MSGSQLLSTRNALYQPLNRGRSEIRLLTIEPKSRANYFETIRISPVKCHLSIVSLDDGDVEYEALSYAWGDPSVTKPILVNDQLVPATENLAAALRQIEDDDKQVVLWVDALCINQQDHAERAQQIQLMGDIYSRARRVIGWLGDDDTDIADANIFIHVLAKSRDLLWSLNFGLGKEKTKRSLESVFLFLSKPFWRRVWTQQEMVLARELIFMCGNKTISFSDLFNFYTNWRSLIADMRPLLDSLNVTEDKTEWIPLFTRLDASLPSILPFKVLQNKEASVNAYSLLSLGRRCEATDPRDRIFALLGLGNSSLALIQPEYKSSVAQVYAEFICCIAQTEGLLLLDGSNGVGAECPSPALEGLPSWVPDYTRIAERHVSSMRVDETSAILGASGKLASRAAFSGSNLVLHASGLLVDRVSGCTMDEEFTERLRKFWGVAFHRQPSYYPQGKPRAQAFLRAVLSEAGSPDATPDGESFAESVVDFLTYIKWSNDTSDDDQGWNKTAHPKLLLLLKLLGSRPDADAAWDAFGKALVKHGDHVRTFLQLTGAVDQLIEPCRSGTVDALSSLSPGCLLESLYGAPDSPYRVEPLPVPDILSPTMDASSFHDEFITRRLKFLRRACMRNLTSSFFCTPQGYLGAGPPGLREGDQICVLLGCTTPLVVRRVEDHYVVVGACFVWGLMDGEAIEGLDPDSAKLQVLKFH